jgi:hypothetical protein
MKRFYSLISLILHPIWIPTWALMVWFGILLSDRISFFSSTFAIFLGYEFVFLALLPTLVAFSKRLGQKTDWEMSNVNSRKWPFLVGGIFWIGYALNICKELGKMGKFLWMTTGSGGILLLILAFCYHRGWKLSAHVSGWAMMLPILACQQHFPSEVRLLLMLECILLVGCVFGIRWISGAHERDELLGGLTLGLFIGFLCINLY